MSVAVGTHNVTAPQWLQDVRENFVASRNRAQGELAPLHRKTTIITNVSNGLEIAGMALVVASIAALFFAIMLVPSIVIGSAAIVVSCTFGGIALGGAIAILGVEVRNKNENYYQREAEKEREFYKYRAGIKFLNRIEQDKELQAAVEPYKESPERYRVDIYREKLNEKKGKKINELDIALCEALSEAIGNTYRPPDEPFIKFFRPPSSPFIELYFQCYKKDQNKYIDQIQDAERKEKCRKLLIQLEEQIEDDI